MKKTCFLIIIIAALFVTMTLTSCSGAKSGFVDGYYTAEVEEFDSHGWKEFVTICVSDGKIAAVEYNAKNKSGMIKSWDMNYMRTMNRVAGSYPNQYTRAFANDLMEHQNADNIDAVSGATHSYDTFDQLAKAVLDLARSGKEQIVFVKGH